MGQHAVVPSALVESSASSYLLMLEPGSWLLPCSTRCRSRSRDAHEAFKNKGEGGQGLLRSEVL